jgi:hypothetical protein
MAAEQSYARHAHHPVPTYIAGTLALLAIVQLAMAWPVVSWAAVFVLALAVVVLVSISRTYIVRLQDRIIQLEMKVRATEILTPEQRVRLAMLTPKQVVALRFASDAELPELVDRASHEHMTPDQIKQAVRNWRADHLRT